MFIEIINFDFIFERVLKLCFLQINSACKQMGMGGGGGGPQYPLKWYTANKYLIHILIQLISP